MCSGDIDVKNVRDGILMQPSHVTAQLINRVPCCLLLQAVVDVTNPMCSDYAADSRAIFPSIIHLLKQCSRSGDSVAPG
jgi:hypothetical protein